MKEKSNYIVQYVGFKTNMTPQEFIKRWTPFATDFKNAGIKTIDLYQVQENDLLTFISRNVWDEKTYFQHFPSGIAGAGTGGGIAVIQFGGYWLQPDHLEGQDKMKIAFLPTAAEPTDATQIARLSCSDRIPYEQMLDILPSSQITFPNQLSCNHLKQM